MPSTGPPDVPLDYELDDLTCPVPGGGVQLVDPVPLDNDFDELPLDSGPSSAGEA